MNRVETQTRILRYLSIIEHQVAMLGRHGQNISMYTETAVAEAMTAATGETWRNLNAANNNTPGIDLISTAHDYGVQATAHVSKAKFDETVKIITKEVTKPQSGLRGLAKVEVVGFTCTKNKAVTAWTQLETTSHLLEIRGISLEKRLGIENLDEAALDHLDRAFQGLASTNGPYQLRSDAEELKFAMIPYLDRPAIRDRRPVELDWNAMQNGMMSIRRLLTQGVNDGGYLITRPYSTFQPEAAHLLKQVYDETHAISRLLRDDAHAPGALSESDGVLIDGHRLRIQECVTALALGARLQPPTW